jgi:hypothetical protein
MESKVAPIINKYWVEDAFPFELIEPLKELNIAASASTATATNVPATSSTEC